MHDSFFLPPKKNPTHTHHTHTHTTHFVLFNAYQRRCTDYSQLLKLECRIFIDLLQKFMQKCTRRSAFCLYSITKNFISEIQYQQKFAYNGLRCKTKNNAYGHEGTDMMACVECNTICITCVITELQQTLPSRINLSRCLFYMIYFTTYVLEHNYYIYVGIFFLFRAQR